LNNKKEGIKLQDYNFENSVNEGIAAGFCDCKVNVLFTSRPAYYPESSTGKAILMFTKLFFNHFRAKAGVVTNFFLSLVYKW
jgi:hypothetical protein